MLTWHSVHVIKLLAIDANPVIFLGLAPSDEQLPGAASVTNAALHASAEHVLAVLDAIENDMVPTVNLNGHHLNLCIDGGTRRTALNVSRARKSATGAFWTRHLCLDNKPGMLSRVFCHKSENSLPKNEKTVKKRGSASHEQRTFYLLSGSLCNTCHLWEEGLLNFVAMEAFMSSCSSNFSGAWGL